MNVIWRKVWFCGGVSVHINIDDQLVRYRFPLSRFRHFTRFPHLRRPLVVIVPFWGVWWANQQYGFPIPVCCTFNDLRRTFRLSGLVIPVFQMQSRQARSDPLHGISIPNSSLALILLWLFLHLHLLVFFSTSLWRCSWSWNGHCWTNTKDYSINHVWNFPLLVSASWVSVSIYLIWILGSKVTPSNNQSRATLWVLETCLILALLSFVVILITASLSSKNVQ